MVGHTPLLSLLLVASAAWLAPLTLRAENDPAGTKSSAPAGVEKTSLGEISNLHRCGPILMASQPKLGDFRLLRDQGVQCIVNFRTAEEIEFDEKGIVEAAGMKYVSIPYSTVESLTDDVFAQSRQLLRENGNRGLCLHCGAAVRVAAVWLAYRVLDEKVSLPVALQEAEGIGLKSKALRERAVQYIESQQATP